ncbi:hypothetical protein HDV01_005276 [Terramyces sp. JEL0728]|nr:hypothetical protein HDV01_005276 [Terramyces sp. JEL0728]
MFRFKKTIREPNVFYISQYGIAIDGIEPLYYPIMWFVDTRDLSVLFGCLKSDGKVHLRWRSNTINSIFRSEYNYGYTITDTEKIILSKSDTNIQEHHQENILDITIQENKEAQLDIPASKYEWVEFESLKADNFIICKITRKKLNILYAKSFIEYFCSKIGLKIETSFIFSNIIKVIDYINNSF